MPPPSAAPAAQSPPNAGWVVVVHPVLFAAAPVTMLYAHNQTRVPLGAMAMPLLLSVGLILAAWAAFSFLLRSWRRGGVFVSVLALLLLGFGHFTTFFGWYARDWGALNWSQERIEWVVLAMSLGILLIIGGWLHRKRPELVGLTLFLNVTAAVLVAIAGFNIARNAMRMPTPVWTTITGPRERVLYDELLVPEIEVRPDVYLIMADAHARADVLTDIYGLDGAQFESQLTQRGFKVAANSWANYSVTVLASPAMLDYDYIRELDGKTEATYPQMHERLRAGRLMARLSAHGYKIIGFETGYEFTRLINADQIFKPRGVTGDEFLYAFLKTTPAPLLFGSWVAVSEGTQKRIDTQFLLDTVPGIADDPEPTFAWIHLTVPHSPFVFGPNGENVQRRYRHLEDFGAQRRDAREQELYRIAYRDQTSFAQRAILQLVDEILARSQEPPIILLVSDHGSRLRMIRDENWRRTDLREAMANLTAVYFPDPEKTAGLYDSITPVNVVRLMLNEYFAADLPMLEDRSFHSPFGTPFWLFEDVTADLSDLSARAAHPSAATD